MIYVSIAAFLIIVYLNITASMDKDGLIKLVKSGQQLIEKAIEKHDAEREEWREERQQLLDRIQAPSFEHLKHHEVKVIKAKNAEKEPPPLEQL